MVFSKFFKPKDTGAAEAPPDAPDDTPDDSTPDEEDDDGAAPEQWNEPTFAERAAAVLPSGSSTGSKRVSALYGDSDVNDDIGPTHFVRADGCHVETIGRQTLVDCTMALGAVTLGYADPTITRAVMEAAGSGNVTGLPHYLEVELAERLTSAIPGAEKVQFLKTGAEAVAAAVRLARTYTGRSAVVGSGYFGWHDWNSSGAGVPAAVSSDFVPVKFNDVAALEQAAGRAGGALAAIVIEPVVDELVSDAFVTKARALCDAAGAVLIFDEIKTGCRLSATGYQQEDGVRPDLLTYGKAMANGYPLAMVCGQAAIMDAARKTWISSTLACESTALAAALAVTEVYTQRDVCEELASIGAAMRKAVGDALAASGLTGVHMAGLDPMWLLRFDDPVAETRFLRIAAHNGVLFKRGAYNFPCLAHDDDALLAIEAAASNAFVALQREHE